MPRNLVVTGLPRSGSTLLAALIDTAPNTICLSEPPMKSAGETTEPVAFAARLRAEFDDIRLALAAGQAVEEQRGPGGERVTNYLEHSGQGSPPTLVASAQPVVRRDVGASFTLGLKSNAKFLAALPELAAFPDLECVAIVRHPRATFASWLRTPFPIGQGSFAVNRWPAMAAISNADDLTLPQKYAGIYDAGVRQLTTTSRVHLLLYEDVVARADTVFERLRLGSGDGRLVKEETIHPHDDRVEEALDALRCLDGPASGLYRF